MVFSLKGHIHTQIADNSQQILHWCHYKMVKLVYGVPSVRQEEFDPTPFRAQCIHKGTLDKFSRFCRYLIHENGEKAVFSNRPHTLQLNGCITERCGGGGQANN
jgi:hypothetical protein